MKKESAWQTAQKLRKNVILLILSALALCASPAIAPADSCIGQTNWRVSGGSWFDCNDNWDHGCPDSSTSAQINNGGTATIGSTGAVSCDLTLGGAATDSGTLVVDHGVLNISLDAAVGGYGKGVLTITNGGTVTAALVSIASQTSSNGAATVDGANSKWTLGGELDIGGTTSAVGGTGLLTVTNSGTVTAASVYVGGSGTFTGNATVDTTNGSVTIEGTIEPSSGRLTIGSGDLTFFGNAALMATNVVPASADNVYVSPGAATLTGKLKVTMTGTFTPGTTYTLLHAANGVLGFSRALQ